MQQPGDFSQEPRMKYSEILCTYDMRLIRNISRTIAL